MGKIPEIALPNMDHCGDSVTLPLELSGLGGEESSYDIDFKCSRIEKSVPFSRVEKLAASNHNVSVLMTS